MTDPLRALERSLREGPPDEADYRAESIVVDNRVVLGPGAVDVEMEQLRRTRLRQRPRSVLPASYLAAVLTIAVVAGGVAILGEVGKPSGTGAATPSISVPALSETFISPRNGFSVNYPAGWTVTPATADWAENTFLPLGNPALDDLRRAGEARLVVASQPLAAGETEAEWLAAFVHPFTGPVVCATDPATSPRLPIGGQSGYLDTPGCPLPGDTKFSTPDLEYSAIVFAGGRAYRFSLDGVVDLAYFQAVLDTVILDPANAVDGGS